jgi:23S rRNA pseudouridine2605 synthase
MARRRDDRAPGAAHSSRGRSRPIGQVPLVRALSKLSLASRSEARALIAEGRVRIDGRLATDARELVTPERLRIAIDDRLAATAAGHGTRRLIVLHKPRGTITTRRDPEGRPTVFDVMGEAARGLVAVGRLDRATSGLLVLTDDTQLAHRLTDPARGILRRYIVTVRGRLTPDTGRRIEEGLAVRGTRGTVEHLHAAALTIRKASGRETHVIVDLDEGRNREVRRLFEAVGHEVTRLHRIAFGPFTLGTLLPGAWREATAAERAVVP